MGSFLFQKLMDTGVRGVDGMIALSNATVDEPETESVTNLHPP